MQCFCFSKFKLSSSEFMAKLEKHTYSKIPGPWDCTRKKNIHKQILCQIGLKKTPKKNMHNICKKICKKYWEKIFSIPQGLSQAKILISVYVCVFIYINLYSTCFATFTFYHQPSTLSHVSWYTWTDRSFAMQLRSRRQFWSRQLKPLKRGRNP